MLWETLFSVYVLSSVCNFVLWNIILCYDFVVSQNSCSQMIKLALLPQQRVYKKHALWQPPSESRPGSVWEAGPADFVPCTAKTVSVQLPCWQWIRVTVTQVMLRRWGCRAPLQSAAAERRCTHSACPVAAGARSCCRHHQESRRRRLCDTHGWLISQPASQAAARTFSRLSPQTCFQF